MNWWETGLNPEGLSQGDIIQDMPFALSPHPYVALAKITVKGGAINWCQTADIPEQAHFLYKGRLAKAIVVSHSCDLDKSKTKARVLVAPIRPLDTLGTDVQATVLEQKNRALMPLPQIPGHGDYYADLRSIMSADRAFMADFSRVASLSAGGLLRLKAQLAVFFLRLDLSDTLAKTPVADDQ